MLHAVLDTNVLVAALRSRRGASFELLRLLGEGRWQLHISTALLLEYEEITNREIQHLWLNPDRVQDVLDALCASAQEHAISFLWRPFLNDADDDFLLELAVAAGTPYIVTHNVRNFAGVERFGIQVLTPAETLLKLQSSK